MNTRVLVLTALMVLPLPAEAQKTSSTATPKQSIEPLPDSPTPNQVPRYIQGRVSIGDPAPGFVLDNADGSSIRLSKLKGYWVLLVFADRGHQLVSMKPIKDDMAAIGVRIVGVCHEKTSRLKTMATKDNLDYLLLGDVTGQVSAVYGLFDHDRSEIEPGFVVIDRAGVVRSAVLGQQLEADQIASIVRLKVTGQP